MKTNVFLDTNIIIDIMGLRQLFCVPAANLLDLACKGEIELYATALTFANALYVLRKTWGTADATLYLKRLNEMIRVAPTTETTGIDCHILSCQYKFFNSQLSILNCQFLTVPPDAPRCTPPS